MAWSFSLRPHITRTSQLKRSSSACAYFFRLPEPSPPLIIRKRSGLSVGRSPRSNPRAASQNCLRDGKPHTTMRSGSQPFMRHTRAASSVGHSSRSERGSHQVACRSTMSAIIVTCGILRP